MEEFKECPECGESFDLMFRNSQSKYCGEVCRAKARSKVQKNLREKRKEKAKNDLDFCSLEAYKACKLRSPKRGLEFSLTPQDFRNNIERPCHYCDDYYNGIGFDRVANDIGYHLSNVVPCCPECNRMKRTQTKEDFISRCTKIANNI